MGKFRGFLKDLIRYGRRPELKLFWLLYFFAAVISVLFLFLPLSLVWLAIGVYLICGFIFLFFNLKIANQNTNVEIKSREFSSIINDLDGGVISYDSTFKIITFNKTAEKIFGLNAQEVVGRQFTPVFSKNPRFRQLTQVIFPSLAPIVRPISEPDVWPQITDIALENPALELRTSLNRLTDENGQILGFFKIIRDRTREKAILASKSEFISVAAHQMRTPLNAINWALETLSKMVKDNKEAVEIIKTGYEVAQRTLKIVNDLLDVSRIEEGKFGYNFEEVDLGEFINNVLTNFKQMADQYQVALYLQPPPEKIQVKIDQQKLAIAFSNLIDNAIKYNIKNGKVEVFVEKIYVSERKNSPFVKITVKDTGVGIPPQETDKVFKKFFRGSNVVQLEPNGSGLGLYIAKNIIRQHGGDIEMESVLDRGTAFSFTLPLNFSLISQKELTEEEM